MNDSSLVVNTWFCFKWLSATFVQRWTMWPCFTLRSNNCCLLLPCRDVRCGNWQVATTFWLRAHNSLRILLVTKSPCTLWQCRYAYQSSQAYSSFDFKSPLGERWAPQLVRWRPAWPCLTIRPVGSTESWPIHSSWPTADRPVLSAPYSMLPSYWR